MSLTENPISGTAELETGSWNREAGRVRERGFVLALILLGFGLRVIRLDFQPLWWDEGYSVWFATHPLAPMIALTAQDIHPPLYYALLHGWTLLLGTGPVALRLLSVVTGTLTIPAIYLSGRRMFTARAALLAALLTAISPLAVFYSQEVRMYGLVALLSTGILLAAWQVLGPRGAAIPERVRESGRPGAGERLPWLSLLTYLLLTTAALYTQYYAMFLPLGLTLFALWQWWRPRNGREGALLMSGTDPRNRAFRRFLGHRERPAEASIPATAPFLDRKLKHTRHTVLYYWLGAQLAVALLYLPWMIYAGPKLVPYVSQKVVQDADRPLGLLAYLGRHLSSFTAGHLEGPLARYWPAALVLLLPAALGLFWILDFRHLHLRRSAAQVQVLRIGERPSHEDQSAILNGPDVSNPQRARCQQSAILMLLFVLVTALLLGWLVGLRYPFFPDRGERLLLLAQPALLLLVAAGLNALIRRVRLAGYAVVGLSVAVSTASLVAFYVTPRYAENDYRPLIARIVEQGLPGDTVFAVYPWQAGYWRSYGDPNGPVGVLTPSVAWGAPVAAALQDALDQGRVWFPAHLSLGGILESRMEDYLRVHSVAFLNEWHGPNTRLSAWTGAPPASPVELAPARFLLPGDDVGMVELSGAGAQIDPVPAANAVMPLSLSWKSESQPPTLDVSVRLTDELDQIWAQHDYEPLGGSGLSGDGESACDACGDKTVLRGREAHPWQAQDRLGLLVPAGTPPGRYHVEVVLRPKDGERPLNAIGADGRILGQSARLFDITVGPADRAVGQEHLPIATGRRVDMQGGLRFLGYSMDDAPATPGDLRKISLFWQATDRPAAEYAAFVQLLDRQGRVAAGWEAPPGAGYPTQVWAPGELIRTQASIRVPASLPDGSYALIGGLFRADDKTRLRTTRRGDHFTLGRLTVRGRPHEMNPPRPSDVLDAGFDKLGRLMGYDFAPPAEGVKPGESLPLTLYWQALGASDRPFTVFVHLLNQKGDALGYGDGEPAGGQLPTTGWLAGEYLTDRHEVVVRADAPTGTYRLAIGLYDPATGERLRTPGGADHVVLDTPVIVR